ncbi:MAG: class I SAM-dependent methyltransferase [Actinomycetota bacterium]|nr:class I SAM-dependent methyltransferase [Actinomycetota bacterium]
MVDQPRQALPERLARVAGVVRGFMPAAEGEALCHFASLVLAPGTTGIEVGSYCGLSTIYLAHAAKEAGATIVSIDHHRGSEENGPGWEYHDAALVDPLSGTLDTLYRFRRTLEVAGIADQVVAVVADSAAAAAVLSPARLVFIDGGHGREIAWRDYRSYAPKVETSGLLIIHDVFEDPKQGGRPPWEIYREAIDSGAFVEFGREGSLRALRRI